MARNLLEVFLTIFRKHSLNFGHNFPEAIKVIVQNWNKTSLGPNPKEKIRDLMDEFARLNNFPVSMIEKLTIHDDGMSTFLSFHYSKIMFIL